MRKTAVFVVLLLLAVSSLVSAKSLKIRFNDAQGKPIPQAELGTLHTFDMAEEPVIDDMTRRDGEAVVNLPNQPVQFSVMFTVPDFGYLVVSIDNEGKGYTKSGSIDFVAEAAKTRLYRVKKALKQKDCAKVQFSKEFYDKLKESEKLVKSAPYKSLALSLAAGEDLTLAKAKYRISRLKTPRKGFLFGCNTFGHPARGLIYDERFKELFNYGTANCYMTKTFPNPGEFNFTRTDGEVDWLLSMGMTARTSAPFYMLDGTTPAWMKEIKWPQAAKLAHDTMIKVGEHYRGKVAYCEVSNEMHDVSNALGLTQAQLIEMTRVLCDSMHEADPDVKRIINCCSMWGEYGCRLHNGVKRKSPYRFLKDCINARVDFEIVGIQVYYPRRDFFEIERMLDRYASLGKKIHITEMGCQSQPGDDPNSQRKKGTQAGWHGTWSEETQADWVEGVYTIFYSKPYIEAVTWWDFADAVSWWAWGGLLRGDCTPKPAYNRLLALQKAWGLK